MENKIVKKLLEHDDRFDGVENTITEFRSEMNERFDIVMGILTKLDQERYAGIARDDRIEEKVDLHEKALEKINKRLKLA